MKSRRNCRKRQYEVYVNQGDKIQRRMQWKQAGKIKIIGEMIDQEKSGTHELCYKKKEDPNTLEN